MRVLRMGSFGPAVELLQLSGLADRIAGGSRLLNIVLGATFDPADLVSYAAGCACFFAAEAVTRYIRSTRKHG